MKGRTKWHMSWSGYIFLTLVTVSIAANTDFAKVAPDGLQDQSPSSSTVPPQQSSSTTTTTASTTVVAPTVTTPSTPSSSSHVMGSRQGMGRIANSGGFTPSVDFAQFAESRPRPTIVHSNNNSNNAAPPKSKVRFAPSTEDKSKGPLLPPFQKLPPVVLKLYETHKDINSSSSEFVDKNVPGESPVRHLPTLFYGDVSPPFPAHPELNSVNPAAPDREDIGIHIHKHHYHGQKHEDQKHVFVKGEGDDLDGHHHGHHHGYYQQPYGNPPHQHVPGGIEEYPSKYYGPKDFGGKFRGQDAIPPPPPPGHSHDSHYGHGPAQGHDGHHNHNDHVSYPLSHPHSKDHDYHDHDHHHHHHHHHDEHGHHNHNHHGKKGGKLEGKVAKALALLVPAGLVLTGVSALFPNFVHVASDDNTGILKRRKRSAYDESDEMMIPAEYLTREHRSLDNGDYSSSYEGAGVSRPIFDSGFDRHHPRAYNDPSSPLYRTSTTVTRRSPQSQNAGGPTSHQAYTNFYFRPSFGHPQEQQFPRHRHHHHHSVSVSPTFTPPSSEEFGVIPPTSSPNIPVSPTQAMQSDKSRGRMRQVVRTRQRFMPMPGNEDESSFVSQDEMPGSNNDETTQRSFQLPITNGSSLSKESRRLTQTLEASGDILTTDDGKEIDLSPDAPVMGLLNSFAQHDKESPDCQKKALCQIAMKGGQPGATKFESFLWNLASLVPDQFSQLYDLEEIFRAIRNRSCHQFQCHSPNLDIQEGQK